MLLLLVEFFVSLLSNQRGKQRLLWKGEGGSLQERKSGWYEHLFDVFCMFY